MKRVALLSAVVALCACSDDLSGPRAIPVESITAPLTVSASSNGAFTETQSVSVPYDLTAFIGCLGETIHVSGKLHIVFHLTLNRNRVTIVNHTNAQGISGTGLTSGRRLQGVNGSHSVFNSGDPSFGTSDPKGAETFTGTTHFRLISQGPGENLLFKQLIHVTRDANGVLRVDRDQLSIECR